MKTFDPSTVVLASASTLDIGILAKIISWGGVDVGYTVYDEDVTYAGLNYASRPFNIGAISASQTGGSSSAFTLELANTDLGISAMCDANDPRGCKVVFYRVFLSDLTKAQVLLSGLEIDGYSVNEVSVVFALVPATARARRKIPARICTRNCGWEYKGVECTYMGVETTCDHTIAACRAYNVTTNPTGRSGGDNSAHFGGIPPAVPVRG